MRRRSVDASASTGTRRFARVTMQAVLLLAAAVAVLLPVSAGAVDGSGDRIYWVNENSGTVQFGNLDGSGAASSVFAGESAPCGVAIDPAAGKIYWANFASGGVRVANLDGSGGVSTLFDAGPRLCGVSIDPAAGKIYWADFAASLIRVGNLDGSGSASTLFVEPSAAGPSGVAIDPSAGKIYWTNQASDEIRVGPLDGSSSGQATTLFGSTDAGDNPIGVALAGGNVYWAALGSGEVRVGKTDGTEAVPLFSGEDGPGGVAVDPDSGKLYWAGWHSGDIRVGNLDGSGAASTLFDGNAFQLFPALLRAPAGAGSPVVSGGSSLGDPLSCSAGTWASDLPGAFLFRAQSTLSYQWQRDGSDIPGASSSSLTWTEPGAYTCRVTASNQAGSTEQTSASFNVSLLGIEKFYDANADGQRNGSEPTINGWKVQVGTTSYLTPKSMKLDPGPYFVSESSPMQTNWRRTTAGSVASLRHRGQSNDGRVWKRLSGRWRGARQGLLGEQERKGPCRGGGSCPHGEPQLAQRRRPELQPYDLQRLRELASEGGHYEHGVLPFGSAGRDEPQRPQRQRQRRPSDLRAGRDQRECSWIRDRERRPDGGERGDRSARPDEEREPLPRVPVDAGRRFVQREREVDVRAVVAVLVQLRVGERAA